MIHFDPSTADEDNHISISLVISHTLKDKSSHGRHSIRERLNGAVTVWKVQFKISGFSLRGENFWTAETDKSYSIRSSNLIQSNVEEVW